MFQLAPHRPAGPGYPDVGAPRKRRLSGIGKPGVKPIRPPAPIVNAKTPVFQQYPAMKAGRGSPTNQILTKMPQI
jgi:hypothetical protein